jgi:hypothetical protein
MTKKIARPVVTLTKEEEREWKQREAVRFILRLRESERETKATLISDLTAGYVLNASRIKAASLAEEKAKISYTFFGDDEKVKAMDLPSLIARLREMRERCLELTMRHADGAEATGDMNSTCAFHRAFGAAALSAAASLYRDAEPVLRYIEKE